MKQQRELKTGVTLQDIYQSHKMRKLFYSVFLATNFLFTFMSAHSQVPGQVKQGPSGIFLFLGKEIPAGKNLLAYKIERSEDSIHWVQIAELKTPATFAAFNQGVENAKLLFPSQPIPPKEKLTQLYQKAISSGSIDSLKGMRLLFPIRVALGIMYYDTTAEKHVTYTYKISATKPSGDLPVSILTDTISLPFRVKFDAIIYSESSLNPNSVLVKWKSAGKNPAPLFMAFTFKYGAPVLAHGTTSRYSVSDTTYYTYYDTTVARYAGKEMQFFISPFDHYGNSGLSSQVAVITQDNFNKGTFMRNHIAYVPSLKGVQVCWHFSDPFTVKTVELYRSEMMKAGFSKFAEVSANDSSYTDQKIVQGKTYYYYIQVVAKAGKRTKQSDLLMVKAEPNSKKEKLNAPKLLQVSEANNHVRLLVEVKDTNAAHLRIYRGTKGKLAVLPGIVNTDKAGFVCFTDTTLATNDIKSILYSVRNESTEGNISEPSDEMPVTIKTNPNEVAYFYAFPSKGGIDLYWDEVVNAKSTYSSYSLARQNGPANSKSPLKELATNLKQNSFRDDQAQGGNQYTYTLRLLDKSGNAGEKSYKITVGSSK